MEIKNIQNKYEMEIRNFMKEREDKYVNKELH
jgi:hypothetical protein